MPKFKAAVLVGLAVFSASVIAYSSPNSSATPIKVRWLIAHEPADAFRRAAKTFAEQLELESKGQMQLQVMMPKDFGSTNGNIEPARIFELLRKGEVELSQTVTTGIGNIEPSFWALDLPFLFRDHEHATKVLEGKVGRGLLASLEKNKLHGLAFTYSGGFRVIPSQSKAIHSHGDFKGMRVRTTNSPVAQATLQMLGATPVPLSLEDGQNALNYGAVDAAETTYIRVNQVIGGNSKFLNETYHSLFLTSIIASDEFYKSLSQENREALERAAHVAARIEREDSIEDGYKARTAFAKAGIKIVKMSAKNEKAFAKAVKPIYRRFEPMFGAKLIKDIVAEK